MSKVKPMYYRTIAQSKDGLTITAHTKVASTLEQAEADVEKYVLPKNLQGNLKSYVTLPVATEESWNEGHINFCPRCGTRLEYIEDANFCGECDECHAEIEVYVRAMQ